MFENIQKIDTNILLFIQDHIQNHNFDKLMPAITFLGNGGMVWFLTALILFFTKENRKVSIMAIGAMILATILCDVIIKNIVQRPRPFIEIENIKMLIQKPTSYSFPSGHTMVSFAAAGILFRRIKKYGFLFLILAFLIAFSRLYLFVHYPSDIVVGMILGLICSKATLHILKYNKIWG